MDKTRILNYLVDAKGTCQMKPLLDKITPEYLEYRRAEINGQETWLK